MILASLFTILLFINNVKSGLLQENVKRDVTRNRGSSKYSNRPSAQYFAVPVSVVYEEGNRNDKSIHPDVTTLRSSTEDKIINPKEKNSAIEKPTQADFKGKSESNVTPPKHADTPSQTIEKSAKNYENMKTSNEKSITTEESIITKEKLEIEPHSTKEPTEPTSESTSKSPNKDVADLEDTLPINGNLNASHNNYKKDDSELKVSHKSNEEDNVDIIVSQNNNEVKEFKLRIDMPRDGLIIPVAVVYDVEPEHLQRRSKSQTTIKPYSTMSKIDEREGKKLATKDNRRNENIRTISKRTQEKDPIVPILQSENYIYSHSGNFHYSYEGGDGTKASERGELRSDKAGEAVEGSFSYIGKDGKDYSLSYTADENGYRPVGAHLPTPPPIPPAIARALKYLATKPTPESITESA